MPTATKHVRKWIPRTWYGQFLFFAAETFIAYFILVGNTRAIAAGNYLGTVATDGFFTLQGGIISKFCVEDKDARTPFAIAGSVLGGMLGSCASIWCSIHLWHSR